MVQQKNNSLIISKCGIKFGQYTFASDKDNMDLIFRERIFDPEATIINIKSNGIYTDRKSLLKTFNDKNIRLINIYRLFDEYLKSEQLVNLVYLPDTLFDENVAQMATMECNKADKFFQKELNRRYAFLTKKKDRTEERLNRFIKSIQKSKNIITDYKSSIENKLNNFFELTSKSEIQQDEK